MNLSTRVYGLLLLAYPPEFRREFGGQMQQVFRDSYRAEARGGSLLSFRLRTFVDLVLTASKERADRSGREGVFMNRRSDLVALLGCVGIIVIALLLLGYLKRNDFFSIYWVGYILDALVSTGVVGNFIVLLLWMTTRLNPFRAALWTLATVHAVLLGVIFIISRSAPGSTDWGGVVLGYLVSFLIWVGLHFAWQSRKFTRIDTDQNKSV